MVNCPFCGAGEHRLTTEKTGEFPALRCAVQCNRCGAMGPWANGEDLEDNKKRAQMLWDMQLASGANA